MAPHGAEVLEPGIDSDTLMQDAQDYDEGEKDEGLDEIGDEPDNEEDEEDDLDWRKLFHNVLTSINLEALKAHALEIRKQQPDFLPTELPALTCRIPNDPFHGSYNLVYVIEFSDDVKWVARVPIQGTRVQEADVDKLNTDYTTLRYIRSTLGMPVPDVFWFETTCERVGVPFALMSFVGGESVCHRWHDKEWITEEKRLRILTNLVHVMAKLQQPRFNKVGTLRFSDEKTVSYIGPLHTVIEVDEEYIEHGIIRVDKCGPFNTLDEWLGHNWDTFEDVPETALWAKGCLEVMKLAMESIPPYLRRSDRFQIDVWDYNYQNIFIDDDCNITGILDWDGIRAVPQGMGCTRYPSWITRDWDPGSYEPALDGNWDESEEDPPEVLSRYRRHYADTFASLGLPGYDPRETKLSHILEAINIGTGDRFARQYIMKVLLNHAYGCTDPPWEASKDWPWEYSEITRTLMDPSNPGAKAMRKEILKQFGKMWHAEWETQEPVGRGKGGSKGYRQYLQRFWPTKQHRATEQPTIRKKGEGSRGYRRYLTRFLSSRQGGLMATLKR